VKPTKLLAIVLAACAALAALSPRSSLGLERNFAGSAQLDYRFVPTQPKATTLNQDDASPLNTFIGEVALKLAVDVSDHFSANVKVCYGCHGFEMAMGYIDYRVADELNFRVGRFSPSFGAFNLRHDPANHYLTDKPLPYDMGRMLRNQEWNQGVLPSPFPDNGIEINGTHWFGNVMELDYALYAVSGFKADAGQFDLDFKQSRMPYYWDNNNRPTLGGRVATTFRLSPTSDLTFGGSAQYGTFDPEHKLGYSIMGSDLSLRVGRTDVRLEYLVRRQEFDIGNPGALRYGIPGLRGNFFAKHGAYFEIKQPIVSYVDMIARVDGMYREGNLVRESPLSKRSTVLRYTLGTMITFEPGLRAKLSAELWDFSDVDALGRHTDVSVHAALVGTY
jgi:hypothetical protein